MYYATYPYLVAGLLVSLVLYRVRTSRANAALLRGPPRKSWFLGHEEVLRSQKNVAELEEQWTQEYGTVLRIGGFYGHDTILVSDAKALQRIFAAVDIYVKGADEKRFAHAIFGPGLVTVSGSTHQRQRRIMNPAFSAPQVRAFVDAMQLIGAKMVDKVKIELERDDTSVVDVLDWLSRIALDALGVATFRHDFGALDGLKESMLISDTQRAAIQEASTNPSLITILIMSLTRVLPSWAGALLNFLPMLENQKLTKFQRVSRNLAVGIMERASNDQDKAGNDVVGLLLASQSSQDPTKRMSKKEILAQMSTIMGAGQDTSSITMAFLLHELAKHPADQERLRAEISGLYAKKQNSELFKAKDLDDLPFLNAVVKETLRLYPNVHTLSRRAFQDDVLPLAEPVTLADGTSTKSVPVAKGQNVLVSLRTYNRLPSVWGRDSDTWNPLRFLNERDKPTNVGVYANLISFSAGPRSCIGWQFALAELQVLTVLMVRHFEFRVAVDIREVASLFTIFPGIEGKDSEGAQLPLELRVI